MEDREAHAEYGGRECFPHLHLLPVLATWAIRSKRACSTTTTPPFKRRFCEQMS